MNKLKNLIAIALSFFTIFGFSIGNLTVLGQQPDVDLIPPSGKLINLEADSAQQSLPIYVALGDSVPANYGLASESSGYVALLSGKITADGYPNVPINLAVSGLTTTTLLGGLTNLQTQNPSGYEALKSAEIITLNIGGNNVLGPMLTILSTFCAQNGINLAALTPADIQKLAGFTLSPADIAELSVGAQTFSTEFQQIITWLKTNNPTAKLIVSTLYNPIPEGLAMYDSSEQMIRGMNSLIEAGAAGGSYAIADTYSGFKSAEIAVTNFNLNPAAGSLSVDIHPNTEGHGLMAQIHYETYKTMPTITSFTAVQTGGANGTADSTGIALTFNKPVTGLTANHITITNVTGSVVKGNLTGSGTSWTIGLTSVTSQGEVTVNVSDFGNFIVTPKSQAVAVYKDLTTYTITFDPNGGTVNPSTMTTGANKKLASLPTPTRSGNYYFDGWFTAKSGGTKITTNTVFTADTTVFAQWYSSGSGSGGSGGRSSSTTSSTEYSVKAESGRTWSKESSEGYTLELDVNFLKFRSVQVDGNSLTKNTDYLAVSGSTIITLLPNYLKTLDPKEHTIRINFTDGYADSKFTIATSKPTTDTPAAIPNNQPNIDTPSTKGNNPFNDVKESDWFYKAVINAYENKLFSGITDTTFSPQTPMTRGMFATVLARLEGAELTGYSESPFDDIDMATWYGSSVAWAADKKIITGYPDRTFAPNQPITREQMALILSNYINYKGIAFSKTGSNELFSDSSQFSSWAVDAIANMKALGLISGTEGNRFNPKATATRAEVAQIFLNYLNVALTD